MALHSDDLSANVGEKRIIDAAPVNRQEEQFEYALRPKTLNEYVGQDKVREQLSIFIQAAKNRGDALDHTLLFGPPGLFVLTAPNQKSDPLIGFATVDELIAWIEQRR